MSRFLLFASLLLAVGVVPCDLSEARATETPAQPEREAEPVADDAQAPAPQKAEPVADGAEAPAHPEESPEPGAGAGDAPADEADDAASATEAQAPPEQGPKEIEGMSILGNREAPKSLVIVPWKSSELGDAVGISTMLDDSREPIDREEFMRALSFYEIRSEGTP